MEDEVRMLVKELVLEVRTKHAEKALAPGLECHCEFCEPPEGSLLQRIEVGDA
jgi:hypothetical protein